MTTKDRLFDLLSRTILEQDCWSNDGESGHKTLMYIAGYNDALRAIDDEQETEEER